MAIDWSILRNPGAVDVAGNFARGYEVADKIISSVQEKHALGALAANPDDRNALAALYRVNPSVAAHMEALNEHRHEVTRKTDARNALGTIMQTLGPQQFSDFGQQPNAFTGRLPEPNIDAPVVSPPGPAMVAEAARDTPGTAIDAPSKTGATDPKAEAAPAPAQSSDPITITAKHAPADATPELAGAWRDYASNDPEGAMKTLIDRHKLNEEQATDLAAQMDIIGRCNTGRRLATTPRISRRNTAPRPSSKSRRRR
jgi:hypothetical protein